MVDVRVLVSGASIAGPALAHWLHRRGARVTVVEQSPALRPGGQAVDARGVAKDVIRRMGLDEAVRAVCTDAAGAHTVDADGTVLETFRVEDDGGDGYISAPMGCTRRCVGWSSGRGSGSSATSGWCSPSTRCPTSSGWAAG